MKNTLLALSFLPFSLIGKDNSHAKELKVIGTFTTRLEAEPPMFLKAFEILENKLAV